MKQQRQETKAKIAANPAANAAPTPLSARDAFEVWYHRFDPTWQGNVRTWLREIGADDYADKLDRLAELMARRGGVELEMTVGPNSPTAIL